MAVVNIVKTLTKVKALVLPSIVFVAVCGAVVTAEAQTICGKRAKFLEHLDRNFREHPSYMALTETGKVLEVFTSEAGTWTILLTDSHGQTCLVSAGEAWETLPSLPGRKS